MMKLSRFLMPYRNMLIVVITLALGQALLNLYLPDLMADIVDRGIVKSNIAYIWAIGGLMLLVALGSILCAVVGIFFSSQVALGFGKDIRAELFAHVQRFSPSEFDAISTASLITRTTNDTTQVQNVLVMLLNVMITSPITMIGGIILAIHQDGGLAWIFVVIIPVLVVVIIALMSKAIPLFTVLQLKLDRLNLILGESLSGVRVIRAFDRSQQEERRFDEASFALTSVAITVNRLVASLMPILLLILNVSSIAILWFGAIRINNGNIQVGAVFAFLQYAMQILFALLMVSMMFAMLPRASVSAARINEVLAIKPAIIDAALVKPADVLEGSVEFQDVTFSYPGAEEPALANISFTARPGKVTAIIGGTGAGKSTLVNLIPRFYDADGGRVLVNGVDVREIAQQGLRAKIGFVPQKAYLFSGTIAENIRVGKLGASLEEITHAVEIAQASEFVARMPGGLDAFIAQGGSNVSGGQKQRLSIARALVRKPEILVFDDSFSALDFKTDAQLRLALKKELLNVIVLIVTQRASTIIEADQIIVLDEGRIVGLGVHRELMETCTVYREIVASQLALEECAEEIA
ncbi:MAG TPA: ABC transporter ATP-binding protein [Ktedonobacteraceae bacterium]|nr:ABC transporter ATP-binding protein [Ktedonobacteraceae bacterium]